MKMTYPVLYLCAVASALVLQGGAYERHGAFYVGVLRYVYKTTDGNQGNCCDGNPGVNGTCDQSCDLYFNITVEGLDGGPNLTRRISDQPIGIQEAVKFPSANEGVTNPFSFDFIQWMGNVNVTVTVYTEVRGDQEGAVVVDEFLFHFIHNGPTDFFIFQSAATSAAAKSSSMAILFRYICDAAYHTIPCFTDCRNHTADETCPLTSPSPTIPDITYTGFPNLRCDNRTGQASNENCSTPEMTTEVTSTTLNIETTTNRKYLDGGTNVSVKIISTNKETPTSTSTSTSTSTTSSTTSTISTTTIPQTTPTAKSTSTTITIQSTKATTNTNIDVTDKTTTEPDKGSTEGPLLHITSGSNASPEVTTQPELLMTTEDHFTRVYESMPYWPAIVGGVLGGIALIAVVGFVAYYKRQKKMQRRQDIYNVNPKILRNFDVYEENGTSGRADVPLETEHV